MNIVSPDVLTEKPIDVIEKQEEKLEGKQIDSKDIVKKQEEKQIDSKNIVKKQEERQINSKYTVEKQIDSKNTVEKQCKTPKQETQNHPIKFESNKESENIKVEVSKKCLKLIPAKSQTVRLKNPRNQVLSENNQGTSTAVNEVKTRKNSGEVITTPISMLSENIKRSDKFDERAVELSSLHEKIINEKQRLNCLLQKYNTRN